MRNGNTNINEISNDWGTVLTVPMRNGNTPPIRQTITVAIRSYRTYEEWKQVWKDGNQIRYIRSYRTYEEWKRG